MRSSLKLIKLRGHHLICLHFFKGEGYNPEFVKNLAKVLERAESGDEIEVSSGADVICKMCPYLKGGKCFYDKDADAGIREMDRTALTLLGLKSRDKVTWSASREKVPAIFRMWFGKYCPECDWRRACENNGKFLRLIND